MMWSNNLLSTVVLMFSPQESRELKLWGVSKNFYWAVKSVVPRQEQIIYSKIRCLQSQLPGLESVYRDSIRNENKFEDKETMLNFERALLAFKKANLPDEYDIY